MRRATLPELRPPDTLADVWSWWRAHYRHDGKWEQQWRDYILPELGALYPSELRPARVEALLSRLEQAKSAETVNSVRSKLRRVIRDAQANGRWSRRNPVDATKPRKVPHRRWPTLTVREARLLLSDPGPFLTLWALSVYLGLRKGEALALQRQDIDLKERTLHVRRSHERDTTKTNAERLLPVARELLPYLRRHLKRQRGELLFPNSKGLLRRRDSKLNMRLRSAFKRVGIVVGYERICRRCGTHEESKSNKPGRCKACGMRLWVEPVPRHLRAQDLRHTFSTLATEAGVSEEIIEITMGHTIPGSRGAYKHLSLNYHRRELEKLSLTRRRSR